ncbi:hypothetical protein ACEPAG_8671 [Sanghuangporus baumii]
MPGLFSWYNNQYSSWNRMRRIQAPQTVARVDSHTSRVATAIHNGNDAVPVNPANANAGDVLINMGDLALNSPTSPTGKDGKDTLFGPSIGVVSTAPEWCAVDAVLDEKLFKSEKKLEYNEKFDDEAESDEDELTPEIVKEWVRRSKEPSEPTTTLQALVNLKRPSIRLSPLAADSSDPSAPSSSPDEPTDSQGKLHQQHGLEFEFDCDAPQCLISLHAFGVPASLGEPDEQKHSAHLHVSGNEAGKENERLVLFEMTLPGGFARKLTLGDGAVLELARLEAAAKAYRAQLAAAAASASSANLSTTGGSGTNTPGGAGNGERHEHHRRLLTTFFRKRGNAHNNSSQSQLGQAQAPIPAPTIAAGPALAVVDAEADHLHPNAAGGTISVQNQNTLATFFAGGDAEKARRKKEAEEQGVRVAIRIAARDSEGRPMKVRNEQVTYLHIVRQGSPSSTTAAGVILGAGSSTAPETNDNSVESGATPEEQATREQAKKEEEKADEDDNRPWVVRVVKREARIGAHSFQLHEIYGLTAHASASDNTNGAHHVTPSSPSSSPDQHTYPPTPGQAPPVATEADDSPAECLLCLSAAREVVLLPCRHLVACRECAVNMVEFGAGGTVVQPAAAATASADAEAPSNTGGENNGGANAEGGTQPTAAAPQNPTHATRRKRKAKGWFCPVCRQPYTSLLRITTAPPPSKGLGLGSPGSGTDGVNQSGDAKRISLTSSLDVNEAAGADSQGQLAHPLAPVLESGVAVPAAAVTSTPRTNLSSENVNNAYVNANADGTMERGGGGLVSLGLARPGFLRRISGRAAVPAGNGRERDLERGA